ncbi:MAG: transcriptional repressor [Bacteroidales bacterium]|nr:transcriptional repressor [Bacteroidales bacterium]
MRYLKAVDVPHDHPTAEEVGQFIRKKHPDIATGTVYKTLETLVEKDILKRVKTDHGLLRYDAVNDEHHHIYCTHCDRIEDYYDGELTNMIYNYFEKKHIPGFTIEDIKLQIVGRYTDQRESVTKTGRYTGKSESVTKTGRYNGKSESVRNTGKSTDKMNSGTKG